MKENSNNDLKNYFLNNQGRLIYKWDHFFEIYENHFSRFRNKEITIVEIGVLQGGSLQMWRHYFGEKAIICGIDIDPRCQVFEEGNTRIFIGSQSDRAFLKQLKSHFPKIDILIDDGGHGMKQQRITFEELFDWIDSDGVYLCEDTHTSYWLKYGGGHRRRGTFIEYTKNFIDYLHAYHSEQRSLQVTSFTNSVKSVHYYDSVVVVEKGKKTKPFAEKRGVPTFPEFPQNKTKLYRFRKSIIKGTLYSINWFLRLLNLPGFYWR